MNKNFDSCLKYLFEEEGGYTNHPRDPGGMTNLGVTHIDWAAWIGHEPSEEEMKSLTKEMVAPLYKKKYWDVCHCDELPSGVDYAVFDLAVNSGTARAAKYLQEIVGAKTDGVIGPQTLEIVGHVTPTTIVTEICDKRRDFIRAIRTYDVFGKGWEARISRVENRAFGMASE